MLCAVLVQDANELHCGLEMPPAMHPLPFMPFDDLVTAGSIAASEGRLGAAGVSWNPAKLNIWCPSPASSAKHATPALAAMA